MNRHRDRRHDRMPAAPPLVLCEFAEVTLPDHETYSPFCMKVHRALRLAGLAYESRRFRDPGEARHINPQRQFPVLLVEGDAVTDSTAILARIGELAPGLFATDERARAESRLWEEYADTALNGFVVAARWADARNWSATKEAYFGSVPAPLRGLIANRIRRRVVASLHARDVWRAGPDACWKRFRAQLDDLERRAPREGFWLGEKPLEADLALFAQLHAFRTPLTPWQGAELRARTALSTYLDRVHEATRLGAAARAHPRAA
jgi:glutathione S-transferase